jgi:stearoyl-CoA desaturase (delta-9 desaturase)
MTNVSKYFLKVHLPLLLLGIFLFFKIENLSIFFISFLSSYILIYWIGYNFYHRTYAHKQVNLTNIGKIIVSFLGMFCLLGDALTYSLTHRYHHRYSDTEKDLHSPIHGFWHSFIGWCFKKNNLTLYLHLIKDYSLNKDRYLFVLKDYQISIIYSTVLLLSIISYEVCLGLIVAMFFCFLIEMLSNAIFNHSKELKSAKNNKVYSWLSLSSYHKDHHDNPTSIQYDDPSLFLIKILKWMKVIA